MWHDVVVCTFLMVEGGHLEIRKGGRRKSGKVELWKSEASSMKQGKWGLFMYGATCRVRVLYIWGFPKIRGTL